ncbi:MAG: zinc ABC transporter substrate-binding protein [Verrucomicrobiales bacterium]|nr:zinc ABC transporter substrate-binding protein [Verrucomicrobiales bacterium]
MRLVYLLPIVIIATLATHRACNRNQSASPQDGLLPAPLTAGPDDRLTIYTTFYPTTYLTSQIVQGVADVVCPVPAGADPIFWQPDDASIAAYQAADLIVINGAGFEKWVATTTLPTGNIVDTSKPLGGDFLKYKDAITHSHGEGAEHSHEGTDGHTWVDPQNAITQAGEILAALTEQFPDQSATLQTNFDALSEKLGSLHQSLNTVPAGTPLLANHPAYNYLARRHGWEIENLDLDPAAAPSEAQLLEIQVVLQDHPAKIILWKSSPLPATAALLKDQFGLTSLTFSPCESPPPEGDYLSSMQQSISTLTGALTK